MKKLYVSLLFYVFAGAVAAQQNPTPTAATERIKSAEKRKELSKNSLASVVSFRSIGPTVMSGRVVDIEVNPIDPSVFYVCYASGGLWKTESSGASFTPLFDREAVMTVGDVAVDWKNNTIWLGTGENNSSRSSYAGNGMYKSTDGGKTWQHIGLDETHHIGRVVINAANPNSVCVAALGHLYSANKERGIYLTNDGGKTWKQTLFVNENAGAIDLVADQNNPNVLYAAIWERSRRAWNFQGAGKSSGIYKSTDGGESWTLLTTAQSGFPTGEGVGRIGLTTFGSTVWAILDNNAPKKEDPKKKKDELTKGVLRGMSKDDFLKLEKRQIAKFLKNNGFPEKYTADKIIEMILQDKIKPQNLVEYLEDANANLTDVDFIGAEVYRSDDGGKTWKRTHENYIDGMFFSYGYYFAQIRAANNNELYILGYRLAKSGDGGRTWKDISGDNVHADHHALWVNPNRAGHLINGNDGGVNITYDNGKSWFFCNSAAVGQFYAISYDMDEPYNIYGGLQDNGVWYGSSKSELSDEWQSSGQSPFKNLLGGDGMYVQVDPRDNNTVYTGYQFGNYFRINKTTGKRKYITPRHDFGERPYRWNWQAPLQISSHNSDVLYFGAHKLFRSMNKGEKWEAISGDLTKGGIKGNVPYGTISTVHESPLRFGLVYVGTDDGLVHVTRDNGETWKKISDRLPQNLWVSRVQASMYDKATVYVTLNGYRWDDFNAYIYVSKDYGETWKRLGTNLPAEPVNVIREDPKNPDILYIGTDHALYASLDNGENFMTLDNGLPSVAVHDLFVHPRESELVAGTHGRSLYVADVSLLQQITPSVRSKDWHIFEIPKVKYSSNWGKKAGDWDDKTNEPKWRMPIYSARANELGLIVKLGDIVLKRLRLQVPKGLSFVDYDLTYEDGLQGLLEKHFAEQAKEREKTKDAKDAEPVEVKKAENGKTYLPRGKYRLEMEKDGKFIEKELIIE